MAAYEVLLLNTAIPQIQAAQSGDTYVVPRDIAFSTVASFAAGAEATPSIVATGDTNTGIWFPAADTVAISTGGISRMRLDSSGNLGLGVTPSAWYSTTKAIDINSGGSVYGGTVGFGISVSVAGNSYFDANVSPTYKVSGNATEYRQTFDGKHIWLTAPSGTADGTAATSLTSVQNGNSYTIKVAGTTDFTLIGAANNNVGTVFTKSGGTGAGTGTVSQNISFTQAMTLSSDGTFRVKGAGTAGTTDAVQFSGSAPASSLILDSSGNLGVGTASPLAKLHVQNQVYIKGTGGGDGTIGIDINSGASAVTTSAHAIRTGGGTGNLLIIETQTANSNGQILFQTNGTERARITSGGNLDLQKNIGLGGASATTSGTGITFPATQSASSDANTLDDYEEGEYDVTISASSSGTVTLTAGENRFSYTKIGRQVTITGRIEITSVSSPVGFFNISLPFAIADLTESAGRGAAAITVVNVVSANVADFLPISIEGESNLRVYLGDANDLQDDSAQQLQALTGIYVTFTYFA